MKILGSFSKFCKSGLQKSLGFPYVSLWLRTWFRASPAKTWQNHEISIWLVWLLPDGRKWMWNDVSGPGTFPGHVGTDWAGPSDDLAGFGLECAPPYGVNSQWSYPDWATKPLGIQLMEHLDRWFAFSKMARLGWTRRRIPKTSQDSSGQNVRTRRSKISNSMYMLPIVQNQIISSANADFRCCSTVQSPIWLR